MQLDNVIKLKKKHADIDYKGKDDEVARYCIGFSVVILEQYYFIPCPYETEITLDNASTYQVKGKEYCQIHSYCFACSFCQNNMRGNAKVSLPPLLRGDSLWYLRQNSR